MKFNNETIIITDPCYFIKDSDWDAGWYEDGNLSDLGINGGATDTIYGDWSCTTYDGSDNVIGEFCADAGMVAVASLKDVLVYNPEFDYHINNPSTTTTIENFAGEVDFVCHDGGMLSVEGNGNIIFYTKQTGL